MAGKDRERRRRHEEAADWLLRRREGALSATDEQAFREWLDGDPQNLKAYQAAERVMGEARSAIRSEPALETFGPKPRARSGGAVLGSLLVLAALGSAFLLFDGPMRLRADVMAASGEMPGFTLEDGSTMQLNASSAASFDFDGTRRVVRLLRGQAYFEVAADPARPFIVEAGGVDITALGTAFDARLDETGTQVTVTEHAVLVRSADAGDEGLRVDEGQRLSHDASSGRKSIARADSGAALAWRRGQLVVDGAPLSYVLEEIGRHFAGRIVVADAELSRRRVSGTITVVRTDAALQFLESALGVTVTRLGPVILVRG